MSCRLLLAFLFLGLAGCVSTPNTAALHIGMTKAEAIAAMGEPTSVSAQAGYEYLNYVLSEMSPSGYGTMSRPYYVRLVDGHVQAFGYSEQINRTLPPPSGVANARAHTEALHIGMTKDEAIAAMGQPTSVGAQGSFEFLNYSMTETSPTGYSTMMRPYYVRLIDGKVEAFGFSEQISRGSTPIPSSSSQRPPVTAASADEVAIVAIEPATLIPGQSQTVTVRVKYAVRSRPKAVIQILFNVVDQARFRSLGEQVVSAGSGEAVITAQVTPVDWGVAGDYRVAVHMVDYPRVPGQPTRPFAWVISPIPLSKK